MEGAGSSGATEGTGICPSCHAIPREGFASCREMWERLQLQSLSNFAYARFHRPIVDAYALQHPEPYCRSAKSYAAHLTGICVAVEHHGDARVNLAVQRWLSGNPEIDKPPLPGARGALTIADVLAADGPEQVRAALQAWFHSTWQAYAAHHELARAWIREALGAGRA